MNERQWPTCLTKASQETVVSNSNLVIESTRGAFDLSPAQTQMGCEILKSSSTFLVIKWSSQIPEDAVNPSERVESTRRPPSESMLHLAIFLINLISL